VVCPPSSSSSIATTLTCEQSYIRLHPKLKK
jgi:hypothetical protein